MTFLEVPFSFLWQKLLFLFFMTDQVLFGLFGSFVWIYLAVNIYRHYILRSGNILRYIRIVGLIKSTQRLLLLLLAVVVAVFVLLQLLLLCCWYIEWKLHAVHFRFSLGPHCLLDCAFNYLSVSGRSFFYISL